MFKRGLLLGIILLLSNCAGTLRLAEKEKKNIKELNSPTVSKSEELNLKERKQY